MYPEYAGTTVIRELADAGTDSDLNQAISQYKPGARQWSQEDRLDFIRWCEGNPDRITLPQAGLYVACLKLERAAAELQQGS